MFKAIKWLLIFLYHFFFIDQATGHQSNTKFFANVGYIIWCCLFPHAVIYGSKATFDLWLVFGAVVIGNRTLNVMMQNKAGVPSTGDGSFKSLVDGGSDNSEDDKPAPKGASKGAAVPKTDDLVN
jgi:hypothetical protein